MAKIKRYLKYIGLTSIEFEIIVSDTQYHELYTRVKHYNGRSIFDCYVSCSYEKQSSYNNYREWFFELCDNTNITSLTSLSVISYNSQCYVLGALISISGIGYGILYITRDNARLIVPSKTDAEYIFNNYKSIK